MPKIDVSSFVQVLTAVLAVVSAYLTYRAYKLTGELDRARASLDKLRNYGKGLTTFSYEYVEAVLLGPRDSGKTSLAQLWRAPWTDIHEIASTGGWTTYEFDLHEYPRVKRYDNLFEVERSFAPVLRIRIHDNPGEERERFKALKAINKLERRIVLVLVFRTGYVGGTFSEAAVNASYFSRAFLQEVEKQMATTHGKIARVMVVFGKADTTPHTTASSLDELKKANAEAVERLEGVFGGLTEYIAVSALTNLNVISLLGRIARVAIQDRGDDEQLEIALANIERKIQAGR